jgi:hypothetical protein
LIQEEKVCGVSQVGCGVHHHKKVPFATGLLVFVVGNWVRLQWNHRGHRGEHWTEEHKKRQRYIQVISLMAPVFAFTSWYGLLAHGPLIHLALDSGREVYESVTLLSFVHLMYNYLEVPLTFKGLCTGYEVGELPSDVENHDFNGTLDSVCWTKDNKQKFQRVANYAYAFTALNVVWALADFGAEYGCIHHARQFTGTGEAGAGFSCLLHNSWWFSGIFIFLLNVVLALEIPGILGIEGSFHKLHDVRAKWKFLCIKGIVAVMFWESMIFKFFEWMNWWPCTKDWWHTDVKVLNNNIQNFAAVMWMAVFSFGNNYAYTAKEFENKEKKLIYKRSGRPVLSTIAVIFAVAVAVAEYLYPNAIQLNRQGMIDFGCNTYVLPLVGWFTQKQYC